MRSQECPVCKKRGKEECFMHHWPETVKKLRAQRTAYRELAKIVENKEGLAFMEEHPKMKAQLCRCRELDPEG